jgi:hypothetical protein
MPIFQVYSINGQGRREILIPGRSGMRQWGSIQIVNNVGHRQESDWAAIRAAIAAGDVVICLSRYETDVLPEFITGKIPFGGNVRFDSKKPLQWQLVIDGPYASVQPLEYICKHCNQEFDSMFQLAGHGRREHRSIVQRTEAELAAQA